MDNGNNVQDENLVNDQVAEALAGAGTTDDAAAAPATNSGFIPTPTVTPVAEDAVDVAPATEPEAAPLVQPPAEAEVTPVVATDDTPAEPAAVTTPAIDEVTVPAGSGDDDELMSVKQKALEQLSPLVSHLDLPPEQKFDTYMEIIRASDDKTLVQPAFDAAQEIEDEDKKAQALLDVVNEVNYLTQDHPAEKE